MNLAAVLLEKPLAGAFEKAKSAGQTNTRRSTKIRPTKPTNTYVRLPRFHFTLPQGPRPKKRTRSKKKCTLQKSRQHPQKHPGNATPLGSKQALGTLQLPRLAATEAPFPPPSSYLKLKLGDMFLLQQQHPTTI